MMACIRHMQADMQVWALDTYMQYVLGSLTCTRVYLYAYYCSFLCVTLHVDVDTQIQVHTFRGVVMAVITRLRTHVKCAHDPFTSLSSSLLLGLFDDDDTYVRSQSTLHRCFFSLTPSLSWPLPLLLLLSFATVLMDCAYEEH